MVVLAGLALFLGQVIPAAADDPVADALRRKEELERAVAVSRANTERYKEAATQFQAAVNQSNATIADLQAKADAAQSQAEQLGYEIQIAEEQLQLVSFQLDETKALVSSLKARVDAENKELSQREAVALYWLYGQLLGEPFAQNVQGTLLYDVRDTGQDVASGARFST